MEDIKRERKPAVAHGRRRGAKPSVAVRSRRTGLTSEHSHTSLSTASASLHRKSRSSADTIGSEDEEDPMASFLPFCAYCENQILIPNSTVLFCSAKCHRLDSEKSLPLTPASPVGMSLSNRSQYFAPSTPPNEFIMPPKNYITPLLPTPPPHQTHFPHHHERSPPTPPPSPNTLQYERKHMRSYSGAAPTNMASSYTRPLPPLHRPSSYSAKDLGLVAPLDLGEEAFAKSVGYGRYASPRSSGLGSLFGGRA